MASGWISSCPCFREWKGERSLASRLSAAAAAAGAAAIGAVAVAAEAAVAAVGVEIETGVEIEAEAEAEAENAKASGYESGVETEVWVAASVHDLVYCVMGCYSWPLARLPRVVQVVGRVAQPSCV